MLRRVEPEIEQCLVWTARDPQPGEPTCLLLRFGTETGGFESGDRRRVQAVDGVGAGPKQSMS